MCIVEENAPDTQGEPQS